MKNKKVLILLGLVFAMIIAVVLARIFEDLPGPDPQDPVPVTASAQNVPVDFDWETYVQNYVDLRNAGIDTEAKAKQHWVEYGKNEGRDYHELKGWNASSDAAQQLPRDFNWQTYVDNYGDLQRLDIHTREQAAEHWMTIGRKEGRSYHKIPYQPLTVRPDFDWQTYVNNYDDLRASGINTKEKAIEHWLKEGKKQGRTHLKISAPANRSWKGSQPIPRTARSGLIPQSAKEAAMESWLEYWTQKTS